MDKDFKYFGMTLAAFAFIFMLPLMLNAVFGDKESDRIAACMTQPNMEYIDGDCRRIQPAE